MLHTLRVDASDRMSVIPLYMISLLTFPFERTRGQSKLRALRSIISLPMSSWLLCILLLSFLSPSSGEREQRSFGSLKGSSRSTSWPSRMEQRNFVSLRESRRATFLWSGNEQKNFGSLHGSWRALSWLGASVQSEAYKTTWAVESHAKALGLLLRRIRIDSPQAMHGEDCFERACQVLIQSDAPQDVHREDCLGQQGQTLAQTDPPKNLRREDCIGKIDRVHIMRGGGSQPGRFWADSQEELGRGGVDRLRGGGTDPACFAVARSPMMREMWDRAKQSTVRPSSVSFSDAC